MPELPDHLRQSDLFQGLADSDVERTLAAARPVSVPAGESVCRQGEVGNSMFLIEEGQVKVVVDRDGEQRVLNYLSEGQHFGEMSMLLGGTRNATVATTVDTRLLELTRDDFDNLLNTVPGFAVNLCRTLGRWLRQEIAGKQQRGRPEVVAVVRTTRRSGLVVRELAAGLVRPGIQLRVLTDRPESWPKDAGYQVQPLPADLSTEPSAAALRRQLSDALSAKRRVLIDIDQQNFDAEQLLQCEFVWWIVEEEEFDRPWDRLLNLVDRHPQLTRPLQLVWLIKSTGRLPAAVRHGLALSRGDLRVLWTEETADSLTLRPHDVARLVHQFQGVHFGLVLGGGGARGLAHLGVLKTLEEAGLYFDRVAGTSAGGMIGALYSAGYDVSELVELFDREMVPPKWLRWFPHSKRWYLLGLYRLGLVRHKMRKYLHDYSFNQLLLPTHTVSVDLIRGAAVVRESGSVVEAVLESINLPGVGLPILREGYAMVDGSVLDNVPVEVCRQRNADFVLAVDIGSKLAAQFVGNTESTPLNEMKRGGIFATIFRVTEIQQYGLAASNLAKSDFLIAPDTSAFPFEDFSRGPDLMNIGRASATAAIPELTRMLNALLVDDLDA